MISIRRRVVRRLRRDAEQFWMTQFRRVVRARGTPLDLGAMQSVLILAPHQDDETLGCGGTIATLRRAGARVEVIFATDGSGSHLDEAVPAAKLASIREEEARSACRALGVGDDECAFLRIPDGTLAAHQEVLEIAIRSAIAKIGAQDIFVCSRYDAHPDHKALYRAADSVSRSMKLRVLQYPIWFWLYRCWSDDKTRLPSNAISVLNAQRSVLRTNRIIVNDVRSYLGTKCDALRCHRTQMGTLPGYEDWPKLEDDFLASFFDGVEVFLVRERTDD